MYQRTVSLLLLAVVGANAMGAAPSGFKGLGLEQALERLEARGLSIVYSSDLVGPGLVVTTEPSSSAPVEILREIVEPLGFAVVANPGGSVMLVRRVGAGSAAAGTDAKTVTRGPELPLDEVVVSASRYQFFRGQVAPETELNIRDIQRLPAIAEDPLRSVERLPGMVNQDYTAKPNVRGGVSDETLVRFDGVRLYNPYHLKDLQNLFSSIDPAIMSDLTVYTAGFPVVYGDRMSSVIDVAPIVPGDEFQGRVAASLFNVGGRVNGSYDGGNGHWVASARRGNLDVYLDLVGSNLGVPTYSDYYARLDHRVGKSAVLSGNVLVFDDDVQVSDSDQEETSTAHYRDEYFWIGIDFGDPDDADSGDAETADPGVAGDRESAGGSIRATRVQLTSKRVGDADLPGVTRGSLSDQRSFTIDAVQADGWWPVHDRSMLRVGAEWSHSTGRYDFSDSAEFAELFLFPGAPQQPTLARDLVVRPTGQQYAAYVNWIVAPFPRMTLDAGLRWDAQTIGGVSSGQLGPRIGVLWSPDSDTRVRASWGRFSQPQRINELPVSDGETSFYPAQRAEHWVASIERRVGRDLGLRLEAYRKSYRDQRPRFENLLDPLVVLPELRPDRIAIVPGTARAEGAELSLTYGNQGPLAGWISYSWSSVADRISGRSVHRSWDQTSAVSAGISYQGPKWEISASASLHSGWRTTAVELATLEPFPLVATGTRNDKQLGHYARLDARVARRYNFNSGQSLVVFLEAANLTNRHNDCCTEYQLEQGVDAQYLDVGVLDSLPIVPSIGFVWEF